MTQTATTPQYRVYLTTKAIQALRFAISEPAHKFTDRHDFKERLARQAKGFRKEAK
jgi:hypothetical protein